jgi:hypothetical protein
MESNLFVLRRRNVSRSFHHSHDFNAIRGRLSTGKAGVRLFGSSPLPLPSTQCHCTLWVGGSASGLEPRPSEAKKL